ncbi:hypothetical protein AMJ74_04610 [candidate division WOR_3 bacterium SM1_77]|jgi:hypothetical protein|uniref:UspA domain-containing protein n=1 Tax=candidate division WOR_3 bacterium SM1_77 TaxID=1703778 RepID=A0A0S8JVW0_UNCW3|nr:MAG: hypothetical protein AMJ74_04610 [candidate division WOR_3 bacterium SM1_77]
MKFDKVLLVLTDDADQSIMPDAVQFCKNAGSRLFVLFVIEHNRIARLASLTQQKVKVVLNKTEEEGWKLLYLVEDDAVENGVWTSLHLEEGHLPQVANHYIESYGIDAMLVKRKDEFRRIFSTCPVPIVGL